jgi:hypothetical protein
VFDEVKVAVSVERAQPCCVKCAAPFPIPDGLRNVMLQPVLVTCGNCGLTHAATFWKAQGRYA